ncbi:uncharacterized protein LOC131629603 [Vicia villosa]|uniref:uncharacterized protein LOC131629603 n=1 Tax=Vicia villosa TaxID=3911 RepID=UPI00273AD743|nr:uncharacterized protein LOC131629603 [Vicia villosa]
MRSRMLPTKSGLETVWAGAVSTTAVARRKKIKEVPTQKDSGASKSNKPSESDSIATSKKPTNSKPPVGSKRQVSSIVVSDDEDKSPPRTRQGHRKRQKAITPSGKEKGLGSSKDDAGTATSGLKTYNLTINVDKPQDISQNKSHVLSPVFEDARPLTTILPNEPVEESQSTDESPATHQDKNLEENHPVSGSDNVNPQPHGSEDTVSEQDAMEEISKPDKHNPPETSPLDTKTTPGATSMPAPTKPTPSELEQLKQTDPLSFLKAMMNVNTTSPSELDISPAVLVESVSTTAVARRKKIKEVPTQKDSGASKSNKPSESDSIATSKKPTNSKPPVGSKRQVSSTVVSDDEDKSPPRTRQGHRKRQKAITPSGKEKGLGSSKFASPSDKASSEESPLKTASNAFVVESHNSSPDNIPPKDDAGTATSGLKTYNLTINVDKPQDISQNKSHVLSPVFEDARPPTTILPNEPVEESHSTDESPATHQDKNLEENHPFSGSDNVNPQPHGSEDTVSEQDAMEEISKPDKHNPPETSPLNTETTPGATSMPAPTKPTPSELEQLKQTDPLSFLKAMMNVNTTSPSKLDISPAVLVESGDKEDIPDLLRQIK